MLINMFIAIREVNQLIDHKYISDSNAIMNWCMLLRTKWSGYSQPTTKASHSKCKMIIRRNSHHLGKHNQNKIHTTGK